MQLSGLTLTAKAIYSVLLWQVTGRPLLIVTDGEPTAHLEPDGEAVFSYPPLPQTLALTVRQMDGLARNGTAVSIVMLGRNPRLSGFVHALARRCGGRVLDPGVDGLGAAVVGDYLRHRRPH